MFWLGKTLGNPNPNLTPDQKSNTIEDQLQIQFRHLKLVRYKYFVFPFEVLIKYELDKFHYTAEIQLQW